MKTYNFVDRDSWLEFRKGKITGSKLGDIIVKRGTGKKIGFYELIADRLSVPEPGNETPMDRGTRLESEALEKCEGLIAKNIKNDLVMWVSDIDDSIAYSPDGLISKSKVIEVKCLSSAKHLQAYFEKKIPDEYEEQYVQAFIVNEKLVTLYFVFYDPRISAVPLHWIEVNREDIEDKIEQYLEYQKQVLKEVEALVNSLSF